MNRALVLTTLVAAAVAAVALTGCRSSSRRRDARNAMYDLEVVAESNARWTGIAVAPDGRTFVNFPRWGTEIPCSVGELLPSGEVIPYPNAELNNWAPGGDVGRFVCVQSVHVDASGRLWILDPASPSFDGVVPGAAKLIEVDLATDEIVRVYSFDESVAPHHSYLNDIRVDVERDVAYMTDSGAGAIVVIDLESGEAMRRLDNHPSTDAEKIVLTIGGKSFLRNGEPPSIRADGLALSSDGSLLYYQALTGRTLWSVPTFHLRSFDVDEEAVERFVSREGNVGSSDAIITGPDDWIWLTSLEEDAIRAFDPETKALRVVAKSPLLAWPDSFAIGPDEAVYVTTAQIHRGDAPKEPYRIFRITRIDNEPTGDAAELEDLEMTPTPGEATPFEEDPDVPGNELATPPAGASS